MRSPVRDDHDLLANRPGRLVGKYDTSREGRGCDGQGNQWALQGWVFLSMVTCAGFKTSKIDSVREGEAPAEPVFPFFK
jgi:hypothetical protein